jgi:hypothetical protein
LWAGSYASFAADTPAIVERNLGEKFLSLRIVAPQASQRASLEEDRGPDARPILCRIPLDAEYEALFILRFAIHLLFS